MIALPSTEALARLAKAIPEGPWLSVQNHPTNACAYVLQDADWAIEIATLYGSHDDVASPKDGDPWGDMPVRDATAEAIALLPALLREVLDRREAEEDARCLSPAQDAVPIEDELDEAWKSGFNAGFGEAMIAAHPPQPSETVAEALKPFANMINHIETDTPDDYHPSWAEFLTVGDFRRAAAALRALKGEA